MPDINKRNIIYYLDPEIGDQYYGDGHPMKPQRVRLTHELVVAYQLYSHLNIYRPEPLPASEMTRFHGKGYIEFLRNVSVDKREEFRNECNKYLGRTEESDCPIFDGFFRFNQRSAGASVGAAQHLIAENADVAINWGGGFHHAKKMEASGFCYVNDIVLAILQLLQKHQRVLYVDIDVHHGDGVEEAFYASDRVLTLSFHKGGNFFPGTGKLEDIGTGMGKNFSLNCPLHEGMDDDTFFAFFKPIFDRSMAVFRPGAVVLQCGADSLTQDRLGCFNLTPKGHGRCVSHVVSQALPTLVVGGGGYTVKNVARCWTYETSVCAGIQINNDIPYNNYYEKFAPDFRLHIEEDNSENFNTESYLKDTQKAVFEVLRKIEIAPSVPIGTSINMNQNGSELNFLDKNGGKLLLRKQNENEFYGKKPFNNLLSRNLYDGNDVSVT